MDIERPLPIDQAGPRPKVVVEQNVDTVQRIRDEIAAHPDANADEIAEILHSKNLDVSAMFVAAELAKHRQQA